MALRCRRVGAVHSIIRDRCGRSGLPVHVRFAPKATDLLRCREMTLRARSRHYDYQANVRSICSQIGSGSLLGLFPNKNSDAFAAIDWAFVGRRSYSQGLSL